MAEGNEDVIPLEEAIRDGHKLVYDFQFLGFHARPITVRETGNHTTLCPTMPTPWRLRLGFVRLPEDNGFYNFSLRLKREDHSPDPVEVSLLLSFLNLKGSDVLPPAPSRRDAMTHEDELESSLFNIPSYLIWAIITVKVNLEIKKCHTDRNWQCAPKFISDESRINKNSKL